MWPYLVEQLTGPRPWGPVAGVCFALAWAVLLVVGAWLWRTDVREHLLPGRVVRPLTAVCGALLAVSALSAGEPVRLVWAAWGVALTTGTYLLLRLAHPAGLGWGDVRLSVLLGGMLGFLSVGHALVGLCAGFLVGGLWGLLLMLLRRATATSRIAFGPMMFTGTVLALVVVP